MKGLLAVVSFLAVAVSSAPLVFDSHLLEHGDVNGRLSVLHHVSFVLGEDPSKVSGASAERLRFVLVVPKLTKLGELGDGFSSGRLGHQAKHDVGHELKHHSFLTVDPGHHLVDFAGLSDCRKWHVVVLRLWSSSGLVHKFLGGVKGVEGGLEHVTFPTVDALVDLVREHTKLDVLKGLLSKKVASHLLTHKLHDSLVKSKLL